MRRPILGLAVCLLALPGCATSPGPGPATDGFSDHADLAARDFAHNPDFACPGADSGLLLIDPHNCGACGHVCPAGRVCDNGLCRIVDCGGGPDLRPCYDQNHDGTCVDVVNDPNNCGACGLACAAKQVCMNGNCQIR